MTRYLATSALVLLTLASVANAQRGGRRDAADDVKAFRNDARPSPAPGSNAAPYTVLMVFWNIKGRELIDTITFHDQVSCVRAGNDLRDIARRNGANLVNWRCTLEGMPACDLKVDLEWRKRLNCRNAFE